MTSFKTHFKTSIFPNESPNSTTHYNCIKLKNYTKLIQHSTWSKASSTTFADTAPSNFLKGRNWTNIKWYQIAPVASRRSPAKHVWVITGKRANSRVLPAKNSLRRKKALRSMKNSTQTAAHPELNFRTTTRNNGAAAFPQSSATGVSTKTHGTWQIQFF